MNSDEKENNTDGEEEFIKYPVEEDEQEEVIEPEVSDVLEDVEEVDELEVSEEDISDQETDGEFLSFEENEFGEDLDVEDAEELDDWDDIEDDNKLDRMFAGGPRRSADDEDVQEIKPRGFTLNKKTGAIAVLAVLVLGGGTLLLGGGDKGTENVASYMPPATTDVPEENITDETAEDLSYAGNMFEVEAPEDISDVEIFAANSNVPQPAPEQNAMVPSLPATEMDTSGFEGEDLAEGVTPDSWLNQPSEQPVDIVNEEPPQLSEEDVQDIPMSANENADVFKASPMPKMEMPAIEAPAEKAAQQQENSKPLTVDIADAIMPEETLPVFPGQETEVEEVPVAKPISKGPSIEEITAGEIYFDSEIQTPALSPEERRLAERRVVDPRTEKGSRYVVVKKKFEAADPETLLVAANRALKLQRYDAALEFFDRLYKKNPRDVRVLMGRAYAQQKTGLHDAAFKSYEEALNVDPENKEALINMMGLLKDRYPSVALRRLVDLRDRYPDHPLIAAQIGLVNAEIGNYAEAMRYLGIAQTLQPRDATHPLNRAIVAERMGNEKMAMDLYQEALEIDAAGDATIDRNMIYDRLATLRKRQNAH